jgi:hypothetical protein
MMIENNYLEESGGDVFHDILENDNKLIIIVTIIKILLWSAGILSLYMVLQELFSIIKSKPYQITSAIHLSIIIAVLISFDLLLVYRQWGDIAFIFLLAGFIVEIGLCLYETLFYVIKPVIKLFKSNFTSKQKFRTIISAFFYALAYICGLVYSYIIILLTIIPIIRHFFGQTDEYGDFHYYEFESNLEDTFFIMLSAIFLILSTFGMNVIHNVIEKKIKGKVSETDEDTYS